MISFAVRISKIIFVLTLPFITLIRGATLVHSFFDIGAYISLVFGIGITVVVLVIYLTLIYERITNKIGDFQAFKSRAGFVIVILIGFCIQGLFFISNSHLKNDSLKAKIRYLHPIIRVAVSGLIFVDKDLIITDAGRRPEDYRKMGLPSKTTSLHYRQKDGFAYAIDLRTENRTWLRNNLLIVYFRLLGFNTIRHVGTADHLHVSLKCHYLPGSL